MKYMAMLLGIIFFAACGNNRNAAETDAEQPVPVVQAQEQSRNIVDQAEAMVMQHESPTPEPLPVDAPEKPAVSPQAAVEKEIARPVKDPEIIQPVVTEERAEPVPVVVQNTEQKPVVVRPEEVKPVQDVQPAVNTKVVTDAWVVPDREKLRANPVAADAESLKTGKALYQKHCASCHGRSGAGDGTKAAQLKAPLLSFRVAAFQDQTDGSLYFKTREGRGDMPSYRKKIPDEEDIWSVVNFLRTLK